MCNLDSHLRFDCVASRKRVERFSAAPLETFVVPRLSELLRSRTTYDDSSSATANRKTVISDA